MATVPTPAPGANPAANPTPTASAPPASSLRSGPAVVDLVGVTKRFGTTAAMDGLDLQVTAGEVHGFLGPNGSGKTTTLRVLLGLLRHDSGSVRLLGGDPWAQAPELHRRLAYVPGDVNLWPNLTGGEMIALLGNLRGGLDPARRAELVERFDLDLRKKGRAYSKGNRQKIALIAALAADVELYLFDEPTSGLDPLMEEEFRACVREIRERGGTVLLSSHILSEVESLADRVTIVRAGRVVETGTMADLRHLTRTIVTAVVTVPPDGQLAGPGVFDLAVDGTRVSASVGAEALGPFLTRLTELGVQSLTSAPPTLEELFLRHYREA